MRDGHRHRLLLVVRDHDAGDADVVDDVDELDLRFLAQLLVERDERLVEKQQLRLLDEAARERDALLLAARELMRLSFRVRLELHELQHRFDPSPNFVLRQAVAAQPEGDVVEHREVRKERVALEHHVHRPLVRRQRRQVAAGELDGSRSRLLEAGEHAQQRRLAAARGAEKGEHLALGDVDRDVVDGALAVEVLDDVRDSKKGVVSHARSVANPQFSNSDPKGVGPSLAEGGVGEEAALARSGCAEFGYADFRTSAIVLIAWSICASSTISGGDSAMMSPVVRMSTFARSTRGTPRTRARPGSPGLDASSMPRDEADVADVDDVRRVRAASAPRPPNTARAMPPRSNRPSSR